MARYHFTKFGTFGSAPDAYISRELYEEYRSKYSYPDKGDILLSASGTIGRIVEYNGEEAYFQDSNIVWLSHDETISNLFLKTLYPIVKWNGVEGSTIKRLYNDNFLKTQFMMPTIAEQTQIGTFFSTLDNLITLHKRKYEALQKLKKSMLKKMFPQKGSLYPEVRFAGFTDAWEQREFGNIAQRLSETAISCDELPYIEYEDVISNQGILNKDVSAKEGEKTGIIFSEENVLYGKLRPYLHNWLNPDFKGVAVGDWWVLKPINADKNFLYRLIQSDNFDSVTNQSTGTKMPRADWKLVSATEFCLPKSLEEQAKIGHYFTDLDNLITLHHRKLEKLKNIKKACLEKMFV